ncbi:hypothetical protein OEZ85_010975 [Tetradesmus obliquus]|uniref:Uncharacterized protein n=1 Tax=Tetradesmus obliquus TaxID=3088 RepID=A0ABY8TNV6_TETOB|nr:hypothetical protein OEZ85_010975 [Tetradesmus obliquus]
MMKMNLRSGKVLRRHVANGRVSKRKKKKRAAPKGPSSKQQQQQQQQEGRVVDAATQTGSPAATAGGVNATTVSNKHGTVAVLADATTASLMQTHLLLASMHIAKSIKAFAGTFRLSLNAQDMSTTILHCILNCCSTQEQVSSAEQVILASLRQQQQQQQQQQPSSTGRVVSDSRALQQLLTDACSSHDVAVTALRNLACKGHRVVIPGLESAGSMQQQLASITGGHNAWGRINSLLNTKEAVADALLQHLQHVHATLPKNSSVHFRLLPGRLYILLRSGSGRVTITQGGGKQFEAQLSSDASKLRQLLYSYHRYDALLRALSARHLQGRPVVCRVLDGRMLAALERSGSRVVSVLSPSWVSSIVAASIRPLPADDAAVVITSADEWFPGAHHVDPESDDVLATAASLSRRSSSSSKHVIITAALAARIGQQQLGMLAHMFESVRIFEGLSFSDGYEAIVRASQQA